MRNIDLFESEISDDVTLDSVFEVEDVLRELKNVSVQSDHLKGLKQWHMKKVDSEIVRLDDKSKQLRKLILNTVKQYEPDQKTFQYPGTGKVQRRVVKGSWDIEDEDVAMKSLDTIGKLGDFKVVKESLDKRAAKKFIKEYCGDGGKLDGVILKDDSESLSISFDEKAAAGKAPVQKTPATKKKAVAQLLDDLETLEV